MTQLALPPGKPRDDRLSTIWAIIESRQTFPAIIGVVSATETDDTMSVARGLAAVSRADGLRTGYVRLGRKPPAAGPTNAYDELVIGPLKSAREAFDAAVVGWRKTYDVVFVDVGHFSGEALFAHVANIGDGVILAVCQDRRVVPADRELKGTLAQLSAKVIGVVKTSEHVPAAVGKSSRRSSLRTWLFPVRQQ